MKKSLVVLFTLLALVALTSCDDDPWRSSYKNFFPHNTRDSPALDFENVMKMIREADQPEANEAEDVYFKLVEWFDQPTSSTAPRSEDDDDCEDGWIVYCIVDLDMLMKASLLNRILGGQTNFTVEELRIIAASIRYVGSGTPKRAMQHLYGARMLFDGQLDCLSASPQAFAMVSDYLDALEAEKGGRYAPDQKSRKYGLIYLARTQTVEGGRTLESAFVKALANGLLNQGDVKGGKNIQREAEHFLANFIFKETVRLMKDSLMILDITDFPSLKYLASRSRFGFDSSEPFIVEFLPTKIELFTEGDPLITPDRKIRTSHVHSLTPLASLNFRLTTNQRTKLGKLFKFYTEKVFSQLPEMSPKKQALMIDVTKAATSANTLYDLTRETFRALDKWMIFAIKETSPPLRKLALERGFRNIVRQFDFALSFRFYLNHDQVLKEYYRLSKTSPPELPATLDFNGDDADLDTPPNVGDCYLAEEEAEDNK